MPTVVRMKGVKIHRASRLLTPRGCCAFHFHAAQFTRSRLRVLLTVLLSKLLGLLVRDVPLRLQVGFVPDEDDDLRAHRAD